MNLCLGTVQFGIDYELNGRQKPSREAAVAMLDYAVTQGVNAIDTSALYGEAEDIVGALLARRNADREKLFLVSKFGTAGLAGLSASECANHILASARESLKRLQTSYLDAYICHVPTAVNDDRILRALTALLESGLARHVGFSAYEVEEAKTAIQSGVVDFLQLPFSVLDQRMATEGVLALARSKGVTLHARSAFVQGLVLKDPAEAPALSQMKELKLGIIGLSAGNGHPYSWSAIFSPHLELLAAFGAALVASIGVHYWRDRLRRA